MIFEDVPGVDQTQSGTDPSRTWCKTKTTASALVIDGLIVVILVTLDKAPITFQRANSLTNSFSLTANSSR